MRCFARATTVVTVSLVSSLAWCWLGLADAAEPAKAEAPAETGPPEVTVKLRNGTSLQCKLLTEVIPVETKYGTLKVPARELLVVYQAVRTDAKLLAETKAAIDDLGSDVLQKREAAEKRLLAIGAPAVPALRKALKDEDAERAERARKVLERILSAGGGSIAESDLVAAKEFAISGTVAVEGYQVDSPLGSITIDLGKIESVCRQPLNVPPLLLPANLSTADPAEVAHWRVGAEEAGWVHATFDDATWKTAEAVEIGRQYIGSSRNDPTTYYCYRRCFLLESQPAKADLTVTAAAYEVHVNGIKVAGGGGTGTHDISGALKRGVNVIALKAKLIASDVRGYMTIGLTAQ